MHSSSSPYSAMKPSDLKVNNRMQILEVFRGGDSLSASTVAKAIGASRQTTMKAIQFFVDKGIVVPDGKAESSSVGGKRAELFRLASDQYLFNVLISPQYLYISLFNYHREIIDTFTQENIGNLSAEEILQAAGMACYRLLLKNGIPGSALQGICIATSGIVDHRTNVLKFNSLFPAWERNVPLAERLGSFFDGQVLCIAENVGKICGSAYLHTPCAQGKRVMTVFSSWGGVCACQMEEERIQNGKDALIGEIGHMIIEPADSEVCACGSRGCFERQVSNERIRQYISREPGLYADSLLSRIPLEKLVVQDVFSASQAGDKFAQSVSKRLAHYFAVAMRNASVSFNPDLVVFQGDFSGIDQCFQEAFTRELESFRYFDSGSPFALEMDTRSIPDLTTLGAHTLLMDRLFSDETIYS